MAKTAEVLSLLGDFAPVSTAQAWDNVGWQIDFSNIVVNKIMLCLTVTETVVKQAISQECDFILSHHPVFFNPIKKIADKYVLEAISHGIQIYSAHTNVDAAQGGTSDLLASKLGFHSLKALNEFVRFQISDQEMNIDEFVQKVKSTLGISNLRLVNTGNLTSVKSVAFCAGSGGSFIPDVKNAGIDLYVTGDVKYHEALDADGLVVFDIGHFESEKFVTEIFKNILHKLDLEIVVANEEDIWKTV